MERANGLHRLSGSCMIGRSVNESVVTAALCSYSVKEFIADTLGLSMRACCARPSQSCKHNILQPVLPNCCA